MGLSLQPTRRMSGKIATLIAVFALIAQPMYGLVADRVANAAPNPVEVKPSSMQGWATENKLPEFVSEPNKQGSLKFNVGNPAARQSLLKFTDSQIPLSDLGNLAYNMRVDESVPASYQLRIMGANRIDGTPSGYTGLVWEPANNALGNGPNGGFTNYSNLEGGKWWSTRPIEGAPDRDTFVLLKTIIDNNPDAFVYQFGLEASNPGAISFVDTLSFNDITYDFKADAPSTPTNLRFTQQHNGKIVEYKNDRYYLNSNDSTESKTIGLKWDHAPATAPGLHYVVQGYFNGVREPRLDQDERVTYLGNSRVGMLGDGVYKFTVVAVDNNTGMQSPATERSITFDSTPPHTLTLSDEVAGKTVGVSSDGILRLSGAVEDNIAMNRVNVQISKPGVSGLYTNLTHNGTGFTGLNPGSWNIDVDTRAVNSTLGLYRQLEDGLYNVNIYATDMAGNTTVKSYQTTIDGEAPYAPEISVVAKANNKELDNGGFTNRYEIVTRWEKPAGDPVRYLYNYWNDTADNWTQENPYPVYTTNLSVGGEFNRGEGTHYVQVFAIDAAGNKSEGSNVFVINYDKTPPSSVTFDGPYSDIDITKPFTISGTYSDDFSGIGRLHLYISANGHQLNGHFGISSSQLNKTDGSFAYTLTQSDLDKLASSQLNLKPGDTFTVRANIHDRANNWNNFTQEFTVLAPSLTADYLVVHSSHMGVGFTVDHLTTNANSVTVELLDSEGNIIATNIGDTDAMRAHLNSNPADGISSPFYLVEGSWSDAYWRLASPVDWSAVGQPTKARITLNYGDNRTKNDEVALTDTGLGHNFASLQAQFIQNRDDRLAAEEAARRAEQDRLAREQQAERDRIAAAAAQAGLDRLARRERAEERVLPITPLATAFGNTALLPGDTVIDDATVETEDTDEDGEVAAAVTDNDDNGEVKAAEDVKDSWSLINLLLTIAVAAASIFALIGLAGKKEDRNIGARLLTVVPALGAGAVLLFAEDFSGQMSWVNVWTLLVGALLVVQMILLANTKTETE